LAFHRNQEGAEHQLETISFLDFLCIFWILFSCKPNTFAWHLAIHSSPSNYLSI